MNNLIDFYIELRGKGTGRLFGVEEKKEIFSDNNKELTSENTKEEFISKSVIVCQQAEPEIISID